MDTTSAPVAPSWLVEMKSLIGRRGPTFQGPDPVNPAMIRHWCAAMGDRNPVYTDDALAAQSSRGGVIAPPAMLQTWVMPGYGVAPPAGDPTAEFHRLADAQGYSSIVATNCEQTYRRELRLGDRIHLTKTIEAVSDEKRTALGAGLFLTTRFEFTDARGEPVADMLHRVLKFKPGIAAPATRVAAPAASAPAPLRPRPNQTQDTAFYFEAAREHRLKIQRCIGCGRLRHPPTAGCAHCGSLQWDTVQSTGRGVLFTFTTVHAPEVAPFKTPYVVGLVELEEGVRVVTELVEVEPDAVAIGMPLELGFMRYDAELVLPVFRPRAGLSSVMQGSERAIGWPGVGPATLPASRHPEAVATGARLFALDIPITRSFIVAAAIATRDYQDVHHDPDIARQRGSLDVFVNILTTTGLVGRYVTDAFGPEARLRKLAIKLGATAYPGDTLAFRGSVVDKRVASDGACDLVVRVVGTVGRGEHVTGEVTLFLASARAASVESPAAGVRPPQ